MSSFQSDQIGVSQRHQFGNHSDDEDELFQNVHIYDTDKGHSGKYKEAGIILDKSQKLDYTMLYDFIDQKLNNSLYHKDHKYSKERLVLLIMKEFVELFQNILNVYQQEIKYSDKEQSQLLIPNVTNLHIKKNILEQEDENISDNVKIEANEQQIESEDKFRIKIGQFQREEYLETFVQQSRSQVQYLYLQLLVILTSISIKLQNNLTSAQKSLYEYQIEKFKKKIQKQEGRNNQESYKVRIEQMVYLFLSINFFSSFFRMGFQNIFQNFDSFMENQENSMLQIFELNAKPFVMEIENITKTLNKLNAYQLENQKFFSETSKVLEHRINNLIAKEQNIQDMNWKLVENSNNQKKNHLEVTQSLFWLGDNIQITSVFQLKQNFIVMSSHICYDDGSQILIDSAGKALSIINFFMNLKILQNVMGLGGFVVDFEKKIVYFQIYSSLRFELDTYKNDKIEVYMERFNKLFQLFIRISYRFMRYYSLEVIYRMGVFGTLMYKQLLLSNLKKIQIKSQEKEANKQQWTIDIFRRRFTESELAEFLKKSVNEKQPIQGEEIYFKEEKLINEVKIIIRQDLLEVEDKNSTNDKIEVSFGELSTQSNLIQSKTMDQQQFKIFSSLKSIKQIGLIDEGGFCKIISVQVKFDEKNELYEYAMKISKSHQLPEQQQQGLDQINREKEMIKTINYQSQSIGSYFFVSSMPDQIFMKKYPISLKNFLKLRKNDISFGQRCEIAKQVIDILLVLQENGIVHGDFKTANIMVEWKSKNEQLRVKLIDFAQSRTQSVRPLNNSASSFPICPPEMLNPQYQFDIKSDIFSFGCILSEIFFCGKHIYTFKNSFTEKSKIEKYMFKLFYTDHDSQEMPEKNISNIVKLVMFLCLHPQTSIRPNPSTLKQIFSLLQNVEILYN